MTCDDVKSADLIERYLRRQLDETEQEAFERHYVGCPGCFELLEAARAVRASLVRAGSPVPEPARRIRRPRLLAWGVAAAATLAAVVSLVLLRDPWPRPGSPATASLEALADVEPPSYTPATLRSSSEAQQVFRAAMEHYQRADYAAAVPGLRRAAALDPSAPNIAFFLGCSLLLCDETDLAVVELRRAVDLGFSPYLEEAHLYLAKALLRQGDLDAAREVLEDLVLLDGDLKPRARDLLPRLEELDVVPP